MSQFNFVDPFSGSAADGTSGIAGNLQADAQRGFQAGQNQLDRNQQTDLQKQSLEAQLKVVKAQQQFQAVEAEKQRQSEVQSQQSSQQFQGQQNTQAQDAAMAQRQAEIQAQQASTAAANKRQDELEKKAAEYKANQMRTMQDLIIATGPQRDELLRQSFEHSVSLDANKLAMTEEATAAAGAEQQLHKEYVDAVSHVSTLTQGLMTQATNQQTAGDASVSDFSGDLADPEEFKKTLGVSRYKLDDKNYVQKIPEFELKSQIQKNVMAKLAISLAKNLNTATGDGVDYTSRISKLTGLISDIANTTDPEIKKQAAAQAQSTVQELEQVSGGKISAYSLQQAYVGLNTALIDAGDLSKLQQRKKTVLEKRGMSLAKAVYDFDGNQEQKKAAALVKEHMSTASTTLTNGLGMVFNSSTVDTPDSLQTTMEYRLANAAQMDPQVPLEYKKTLLSLARNTHARSLLSIYENTLATTASSAKTHKEALEKVKAQKELLSKQEVPLRMKAAKYQQDFFTKIDPQKVLSTFDPSVLSGPQTPFTTPTSVSQPLGGQ